jgi:hypothetical protein
LIENEEELQSIGRIALRSVLLAFAEAIKSQDKAKESEKTE